MADTYCADCKRITEVVFDHSSGDTICSECGLVLESHSIDETSEWRTFANDSAHEDHDPNRVGGPTNPLLADLPTVLTTSITASSDRRSSAVASSLRHHTHGGAANSHSHLLSAFDSISSMADRLGLVPTIKDRATEIYKKVAVSSNTTNTNHRGRQRESLFAACLYIACNQEHLPRTVKEICAVASPSTSKKDLGRAKAFILKQLSSVPGGDFNAGGRTIRAGDFVKRFCSNLGIMNNRVMKAAGEAAHKAEEDVDVRRSPISIAAAVIFIVCQLSPEEKGKPLRDIAIVSGTAEGTIRNVYKDLYPHLGRIIPGWYAKEEDLKSNLCSP